MSDISDDVKITAALHPFRVERADFTVPAGLTVTEIFEVIQPDPLLRRAAHVYVGEYYVPRENWSRVRPKPGSQLTVRAIVAPQGGGGGGKDLLRVILLVAIAASALIFGPMLGAALGFTGALAASVGQAIIGIGGMLLVNALIPPRTLADQGQESPTKFIEGARNRATPFDVVPTVFGQTKVVPLLAAQPITEIVGDDQYLRMLFHWGVGPIDLPSETLKIGETLLSAFDGVEIEHRYGYPGDLPITLYPNAVEQVAFQITLEESAGYTIRTTSADADEIGIDIVFPTGLVNVNDEGERENRSVAMELEFSVAGADDWQSIPIAGAIFTFRQSWTNESGGLFNQITFRGKKTTAVRYGVTWKTPARGQYDVRLKRLTADATSDQIRDVLVWSALRRITDEPPVQSPVPVALTALRIKATDQLANVIDEFNGIPQTVCLDWDTGTSTWILRATRNPASLYRYALQNNNLQSPKPDAAIDLVTLEYWHEFCVSHGFTFDQNRDFGSSVWELLADIAAAGRATPQMIDGVYSVVIDEAKTAISHVTPRNSSGFKASKAFLEKPHAFRVQFPNREKDYRNDELIVYLDDNDASTATKFETIEFPGVTSSALIAKHARFNALVAEHRPEVWNFNQDMERFVYRRGDVVKITHDVLMVGLSFGRIKTVALDIDGNCTGISVDAPVLIEESLSYGFSIRTVGNPAVTAQIVTVAGPQSVFDFISPIPAADAPSVGDLYGFGLLGQETDEALILEVAPQSGEGFVAAISAVPYRPEIYALDGGDIPPFDSKLTPIQIVPDVVVLNTRSDETALTVGSGESLSVHIAVKVQGVTDVTARLQAQVRPSTTEEPFVDAKVDAIIANEIFVGDVRTGEYWDVRLRWNVSGRLPGAWSYINNHLVVGKSSNPDALTGLTISSFGGQAFFRWDQPRELDVIFGGEVRFRHSSDPVPTWSNSTSIGQVAQARALFATLPLKTGTYLARVFDEAGNQSEVMLISSYQASVLAFAPVDAIDEAPTFGGVKDNTIIDGISLKIGGAGQWDDIVDVDAEPDIDAFGGASDITEGTYNFEFGFDFLTVSRVRLTLRILAGVFQVNDLIDAWSENIDDRDNFDGTDTSLADCIVYVSMTNDDPGASPTWGTWERLDSMEVECRGCRFKAVMTSFNRDFNIAVTELGVDAEEVI